MHPLSTSPTRQPLVRRTWQRLAGLVLVGAMAGCASLPPPAPPLAYDEIAQRVAAREPEAQIVRDIRVRGVTGGSPPEASDMAQLAAAGASEAITDAVLIAAWRPPGRTNPALGPGGWAYPGTASSPYPGPYPSPYPGWYPGWWSWGPWPGYGYAPVIGIGAFGGTGPGSTPPPVVPPTSTPAPGVSPGPAVGPGMGSPFRPSFPRAVRRR